MESRTRRGPCSQIEAPEEASLRAGKLWDAAETGAAMRLARVLKMDTFSNHQNYGRSNMLRRGVVTLQYQLYLLSIIIGNAL